MFLLSLLFCFLANASAEQPLSQEEAYQYWTEWDEEEPVTEASPAELENLIIKSPSTYSRSVVEILGLLRKSKVLYERASIAKSEESCRTSGRPVPGVASQDCGLFKFRFEVTFELHGQKSRLAIYGVGHYLKSTESLAGAEVNYFTFTRAD